MSVPASTFNIIDDFKAAMADERLAYDDKDPIVDDGKIHRYHVDGDKGNKQNGWYVLFTDGVPAGSFGSWKDGGTFTWCAKREQELTPQEREENRKRIEAARKQREAERKQRIEAARKMALQVWNESTDAVGHAYLQRKGVRAHGIRVTVQDYALKTQSEKTLNIPTGSLVIPMRDTDATIWSLQFITPDGDKWFLPGGDVDGHYHAMGTPGGRILIIEGYATGSTCLEAAGGGVATAFNAGNLIKVARVIRDANPDAEIAIGADNDQWTQLNDGTPNPGVTQAKAAANAIGASVIIPHFTDEQILEFEEQHGKKPTDWNDLQHVAGIEEVARQLGVPAELPEQQAANEPPLDDYDVPDDDDGDGDDVYTAPDGGADQNSYFRPLGHDRGTLFFLTSRGKQVLGFPMGKMAQKTTLFSLAPMHWWEREFPHEKGFTGRAIDQAVNALIGACYARGVFRIDRIRGRGAWWDDGRVVFHAGDKLYVDGAERKIQEYESRFVYEALPEIRVVIDSQITGKEAVQLHELCTSLAWERGAYGAMLAGWIVVAPVCGALEWRPHIWVTGPSGSGKSWVVSNVVRSALGENALQAQGDSTSAGIRQALGHDALPVVFDEAEGEDHRAAQNMQGVLSLMRQASSETGGQILKGGSDGGAARYTVRSAFCLSSIVPQLKQTADEARVTVLTLRKADQDDAGRVRFREHIAPLSLMLTEEFTLRLQARTLRHLPTLRHNTKVFATAIADHVGSQRLGDQYGPLIAGDYLLHSTKEITPESAREWVSKQDWAETQSATEQSDELKLLAHIMESITEVDPDQGGMIRWSVAELVATASGSPVIKDKRVPENVAAEALSRIGLRADGRTLFISNTHKGLKMLLRDTPWSSGWGRVLGRIDNAITNRPKRFGAVMSKAVGIPIEIAIDTES